MSYQDVKKQFDEVLGSPMSIDSPQLRRFELTLMFEIFGCLDSLSHSYREMLKLQQAKATEAKRGSVK